jgi:hypothetical protein
MGFCFGSNGRAISYTETADISPKSESCRRKRHKKNRIPADGEMGPCGGVIVYQSDITLFFKSLGGRSRKKCLAIVIMCLTLKKKIC